jgi:PEP-CTERM motif
MKLLGLLLGAAAMSCAVPAAAAIFVVDALANSSTSGVGRATLAVAAGQAITISASTSDLWSAGSLPRLADANGLVANRIAAASDDSGPRDGVTQIGTNFGLYTQNGFSAPYASLVGLVGSEYKLIGTNFSGSFASAGTLQLFFWDSNNEDNSGTIAANVSFRDAPPAVPEPATWAMMLIGFSAVGLATRRRRLAVA